VLYAPECVEELFSEVRMCGVLGNPLVRLCNFSHYIPTAVGR
jgi:hypothetical protein